MQQLNCIILLLGLAILSAILGPLVTIAHRELLVVTGSKRGVEIKLELSVEKTSTEEDIRSNVLTGRKLAFGDEVKEHKGTEISGSKTSTGAKHSVGKCGHGGVKDLRENKNYSTNSRKPSNPKDSSSTRMQAGPSMNTVKVEGSKAELALNTANPEHIRKFSSKHSSMNSNGDAINEDWKQKMLEASDEILKFLNKDYNSHAHKRRPVHN